jgi:hypothetical protein
MIDPCILYRNQYKKAKETLAVLETQKAKINLDLELNPICANLNKDLRMINLDIKITLNEMEHAEFRIQEFKTNFLSVKE